MFEFSFTPTLHKTYNDLHPKQYHQGMLRL